MIFIALLLLMLAAVAQQKPKSVFTATEKIEMEKMMEQMPK
jgi:hypothetical protein